MTIDEAIEHERRVAREHRYGEKDHAYHMQLAEWLRKARGAEKAERWYTKKIEELENRANALARLLGESEEENDRLKMQVEALKDYAHALELCMGESQLCEYCPSNGIDFEHNSIHCTIDFDGLRKKAGMEQ
jgi:predicted RNase H-like nuclease (RuvC/YqgF family)